MTLGAGKARSQRPLEEQRAVEELQVEKNQMLMHKTEEEEAAHLVHLKAQKRIKRGLLGSDARAQV